MISTQPINVELGGTKNNSQITFKISSPSFYKPQGTFDTKNKINQPPLHPHLHYQLMKQR